MSTKRQEVVCVVEKAVESPQDFLNVIRKHESKTDSFDLQEFFQSLSKKQHEDLWKHLGELTKATIEKLAAAFSEEILQLDNTLLHILSGVVSFARCAIDQDTPVVPHSFTEAVQQLHDILLELSELDGYLQNTISLLCEKWWSKDVEGKNELMPNTLSYLVARTLSTGAKQVDVKRLWAVRQAFLLLDFDDPSAGIMKSMLLSCCVHPLYLRCDQGRKLISFMFGLHPGFVGDLHQSIKRVIPYCSRAHLKAYGEIYFRSWRFASGPYLKEIEDTCLQDLMYCAVHSSRHGSKSLFGALRLLLGQFQLQRNHKGVTEMFTRLYKPFLWRSLKVANAYVRANAAALLFDGFPLCESDVGKEEADELLQRQFDTMRDLLQDSGVVVRVTAILGVCKVLSTYWEMIPAIVVKTFLQELVENLAWDTASVDVRVAVMQGLCVVLENRMSHHLMKRILPLVQPRIHDTSEKVRLAFLDLLLVVKGLGTIKFWSICPVEHLLARMELDSVPVVKRIAALLVESFQPSQASNLKQLENCIALIEANPNAARRFYHLAVGHLSLDSIVHFILNLLEVVVDCAKQSGEETGGCGEGGALVPQANGGVDEGVVSEEAMDLEEDIENGQDDLRCWSGAAEGDHSVSQEELGMKLRNKTIITGLLETMVILWEGSRENLQQSKAKALRGRLVEAVGRSLPILFDRFKGEESARSALYLLSSHLPKKHITFLTKDALTSLSSPTKTPGRQDYGSLLVALISWGQRDQVVKIIGSMVAQGFAELKKGEEVGGGHVVAVKNGGRKRGGLGKRSKSKEQTGGGEEGSVQGPLALEMLSWVMAHPYCMGELKHAKQFWELSSPLKESMALITHWSDQATPLFLTKAFTCHMKMEMHRLADTEDRSSPQAIYDIMDWCVASLVPLLKESRMTPKAKRREGQGCPDHKGEVAYDVVERTMTLLGDMVMVGMTGAGVEMKIAAFCDVVMATAAGPALIPMACKVLYQLVEVSSRCELEGIHSVGGLRPAAIVMKRTLAVLQGMSLGTEDTFGKVWSQVRPCLVAAVVMGVRLHSLSLSSQEVPVFAALVEGVVQATVGRLRENPEADVPSCLEDLPLFVTSVLGQTCKSKPSTDLFASHLCEYLSQHTLQPPDSFLTHQASLHILMAISKCGSGEELLRCVRPTVKMLQGLTADQRERWSGVVKPLYSLSDHVQEALSV